MCVSVYLVPCHFPTWRLVCPHQGQDVYYFLEIKIWYYASQDGTWAEMQDRMLTPEQLAWLFANNSIFTLNSNIYEACTTVLILCQALCQGERQNSRATFSSPRISNWNNCSTPYGGAKNDPEYKDPLEPGWLPDNKDPSPQSQTVGYTFVAFPPAFNVRLLKEEHVLNLVSLSLCSA